ncbi:MAG: S8 family serine peptidase [Chitinophagaceae bacterium]|nr:S8 family serine peptidase [Chitinophagaceae bacterium]
MSRNTERNLLSVNFFRRRLPSYSFFLSTLFLILIFSVPSHAQKTVGTLHLISGDVLIKENISDAGVQEELRKGKWNNATYAVLMFDAIPSALQLQRLKNNGIEILHYLPDYAYQVRFNFTPSAIVLKDAGVKSVVHLPAAMKYGKELAQKMNQPGSVQSTIKVSVLLHPGVVLNDALKQLMQNGFELTSNQFMNQGLFIGTVPQNNISSVASLPFTAYINENNYQVQPLMQRERGVFGLTGLTSTQGASRQLSGANVTIGVGDNADPTSHVDNVTNLINRSPAFIPGSIHGTHVASLVTGDGIIEERLTGTAPGTRVVSDYFDYIISKTPNYVTDYGMTATNNSYFNGYANCPGDGQYNELSVYADQQIRNNPYLQHIFAAGNDGALTCSPYPAFFATIKSGYQTAKNVFTIGNVNIFNATAVASNSSRGPVKDGRIKPEILASGNAVGGASINNSYTNNFGTSAAAPFVAGVWSLLTERYKQLNGSNPKSALLKMVLCNTANDKGNPGPDYSNGFGWINPQYAVDAIEQSRYYSSSVTTGGNHTQVISVPAGTKQLKVMLYWHDLEGSPLSSTALVNDLDLTVTDGVTYQPLILNPAPGAVNNNAVQGADHLNNIEQVVIDNPGTSVTINVNGFNVTGSQEFFVSYEFIKPELKLLHPYGGEHFTTFASSGRADVIAWQIDDVSNDNITLEYSLDNGATWTVIANNIGPNEIRYYWNVPTVNAQKAKVRIKRTNGSLYSESPGNFVISDLPALTATTPCEGYADLSWTAAAGATDYQVMQLISGVLTTVATTASTTQRISGLDKNTTYWFTVRPRLTDSAGRRAIAKSITPNFASPCTDPFFDNDLKIDALVSPLSGRKNTSSELSATQSITVRLKNLDNAASGTTYTVSYQVNGGAVVNENPNTSIAAGGTLNYTFSTPYDFSAAGTYTVRVFVKQTGDLRTENDEKIYMVRQLNNPPLTLPFTEGFETTGDDEYRSYTFGLNNADRFDYQNTSSNGRLRTFLNSGMQITGSRSAYLDAAQFTGTGSANSLFGTFNLSGVATSALRFDFKFRNHGQLNNTATSVWMRGQDNQPWVQVYNLYANQGEPGDIKQPSINISEVMNNAGQPITSSFQVRFDQGGFTSSNNGSYQADGADIDDGFSFDDIRISAVNNDLTVIQLVAPSTFNCSAGNAAVTIRVKNTTSNTYNNIPVYYRVDNGTAVAGTIPSIGPNATIDYTFSTTADFSAYKAYDIDAWAQLAGDDYPLNDSVTNQFVYNSPAVASYPYFERFENSNGNYFTTRSYSDWKWGSTDALSRALLKKAANGTKAWFTSLAGFYKPNDSSYLYSPCFDLSSLTNPTLSFAHISSQEEGYDYHSIEYSTDNGNTWLRLGVQNGGTNWFTDPANFWRTSYSRWHVSSVAIPTNASSVRFRFLFYSDVLTEREGVGIDDIRIFDRETIYTGVNQINVNQNVSGNNWVDFRNGGNLIASINPGGQNLGSTNVSVYINTGAVRNNGSQYYLDRNIVIQPTNALTDSVQVRFYFTEAEMVAMLSATNCPACSNLTDAFAAGVTKFSGSAAIENGSLLDNIGSYRFINPANVDVVPFNNGYYAEFKVRSFSEFWINSGGSNFNTPLPVTLVNFTANKRYPHIDLNWKTETESNSSHFEVERKIDGEAVFAKIGSVTAAGNSAQTMDYSYKDENVLYRGRRFQYRLKMVDLDGKFSYSNIVTLTSSDEDVFIQQVYNNTGNTLQILTGNKTTVKNMMVRIINATGQTVLQQRFAYQDSRLDVSRLSGGIYIVEIKNEAGDVFLQKFVKQ